MFYQRLLVVLGSFVYAVFSFPRHAQLTIYTVYHSHLSIPITIKEYLLDHHHRKLIHVNRIPAFDIYLLLNVGNNEVT